MQDDLYFEKFIHKYIQAVASFGITKGKGCVRSKSAVFASVWARHIGNELFPSCYPHALKWFDGAEEVPMYYC